MDIVSTTLSNTMALYGEIDGLFTHKGLEALDHADRGPLATRITRAMRHIVEVRESDGYRTAMTDHPNATLATSTHVELVTLYVDFIGCLENPRALALPTNFTLPLTIESS